MPAGLTLVQWSYVAQVVIAVSAALALVGAAAQLLNSRANARRVRAYEYADRFNNPEWTTRASRYRDYWGKHDYQHFKKLKRVQANELLILPNVIEEIAALYHRKLIDRDVAAEVLGLYVEELWTTSLPFVSALRAEHGPDLFSDWEHMQRDTPVRKLKAKKKMDCRRAWHRLLRG